LSAQTAVLVQHSALLEHDACKPVQMHAPFWQNPLLQGVPKARGLILPALQRFSPFFLLHVPRSQRSHSPGLRVHLADRAALTLSVSASSSAPSAPLSAAASARRREPTDIRERARVSKRSAAIAGLLPGDDRR
jgi:hypothetical protein